GSVAHRSHRDPDDEKEVITVALLNKDGGRLMTSHVHEDGSYRIWKSRAGRK
ncbi:hypothetical protein KEM55_007204, partial [Ascosphaera atra]